MVGFRGAAPSAAFADGRIIITQDRQGQNIGSACSACAGNVADGRTEYTIGIICGLWVLYQAQTCRMETYDSRMSVAMTGNMGENRL